MVGKIARGESRRDLSDRVRQLRAHHVQALQHMAVAWAGRALQGHIREGLQRSGETARRCREFIIAMAQKYDPTLEAITDMQIDSAAGLSESLDDFLDHCQRKALPASSNG